MDLKRKLCFIMLCQQRLEMHKTGAPLLFISSTVIEAMAFCSSWKLFQSEHQINKYDKMFISKINAFMMTSN